MPNRILRDWTASDKIDSVDVSTERFFVRLIMKVDDYGRYYANIKMLKSTLFPLRSDIKEADITRWISSCEKAGIIVLYSVSQKEYLQINDFRQKLRQKLEKYPGPDACTTSDLQMTNISIAHVDTKRREVETEKKPEDEGTGAVQRTPAEIILFSKFNEWLDKFAPTVKKLKNPFTIEEYFRLKSDFSKDLIEKLLKAMENKKDLLKKYNSANLTIRNWAARELGDHPTAPAGGGSNLSNAVKEIEGK